MNEQTVIFGSSQHLVGTWTPAGGAVASSAPAVAVLLTNAGVISRIGPRRMNVRLARRLAAAGIPCFRWDLSGLGDSARPRSPLPTRQQFIADTTDAMDETVERYGVECFIMIGFCSGAEIAFASAMSDPRLKAVVLFDHHMYYHYKATLRWYRRRLRELGIAKLPQVLARAVKRNYQAWRSPGELSAAPVDDLQPGAWVTPTLDEYAVQISALVDRGVELFFVYSGVFPAVFNHRSQFDDLYGRYGIPGRVTYEYLPDFDHLITTGKAQHRFIDLIVKWVSPQVQLHKKRGM